MLGLLAASVACHISRPDAAPLVSPDGVYEVRLSGRTTRPFLEHRITADIDRNGDVHSRGRTVYLADLFEPAFARRYRRGDWPAPSILRFAGTRGTASDADRLTVRNTSGRMYPWVRIETALDLFVLLDVKPGFDRTVPVTPQIRGRRLNWLDVIGEAASGEPVRGNGAFEMRQPRTAPFEFEVILETSGIRVEERGGRGELYR